MEPFFVIWLVLMGLAIGSFLNVVIARLPEGQSVVAPRSRCPRCGHQLAWYENIPVVSWLALRGRCSSCKQPISPRYVVVELGTALLFLASFVRFGWSGELVVALTFIAFLVPLVIIDADTYHLEPALLYPATPVLLVARLATGGVDALADGLWGAVAGYLVFRVMEFLGWAATGREALGAGDKFLLAIAGAALGPAALLGVVVLASAQGAVFGIVQLARTGRAGPELATGEGGAVPGLAPEVAGDAAPGRDPWTPAFLRPGLPAWKRLALVPYAVLLQDIPDPPPPDGDGEEPEWIPPVNSMPFGPWIGLGALEVMLAGPAIAAAFRSTPFGFVAELLFAR